MSVFAVVVDDSGAKAAFERLDEKYGETNVRRLDETTALVRTESIAEAVAVAAGIKGSDRDTSGVVLKISMSYAGYTARATWEWLKEAEEAG